ncbi:hypothetical protein RE6C_04500 [Rhodopirellula europaea 6C]|uniref:Uncharacterized protein n=1 Tax=Rhodopirellula europaea 6C TaxID=1263867 RepID=M2AYQ8_9BACT|nr:hypothetical protein RE6C_04500 [Rhodopirellula europaea 6C]
MSCHIHDASPNLWPPNARSLFGLYCVRRGVRDQQGAHALH